MRHPRDLNGFSLIELMIVTAIIAILVAIAVPNLLDSRVRAQVARAKSDMRSMATAIELYAVDYRQHPIPGDEQGSVLLAGEPSVNWLESRTPVSLTTPIAYISGLLPDPFFESELEPEPLYRYATQRMVTQQTGSAAPLAGYVHALTDLSDPSISFFLLSVGPDNTRNLTPPATYDPTNGSVSLGDIPYLGTGKGFKE